MWTVQLSRFLKTILYIWQDYWLSLLYKRLVGPEVLKAEVHMNSGQKKQIRAYLHCTNRKRYVYSPAYNKNIFLKKQWLIVFDISYILSSTHYREGAVTLFALNLNQNEATIGLPAHMANSTIKAFVLQSAEAGEQSLYSR